MCGEPCIHLVQRIAGDAKRGHHLAAGFLALTPLFLLVPCVSAAEYAGKHDRSCEALPQNGAAMLPLRASRAALLQDAVLQTWRGGSPAQRLLKFLLKVVHRFKFHGCTPSIDRWPWREAA